MLTISTLTDFAQARYGGNHSWESVTGLFDNVSKASTNGGHVNSDSTPSQNPGYSTSGSGSSEAVVVIGDQEPYFVTADKTPQVITQHEADGLRELVYTRNENLMFFNHLLNGLNLMWLMVVSIFLFMMQVGFAFMASGAANRKNSASILTNHLIIICSCGIMFFMISADIISDAHGGLIGQE